MTKKKWVTATGAIIIIVGAFLGLFLKALDTATFLILIGMATAAIGIGRKLDRLNSGIKSFLIALLIGIAAPVFAQFQGGLDANQMESGKIANFQNQDYFEVIWDTLYGSEIIMDSIRIDEWTGTTGLFRAKIRIWQIGSPSTGFSYAWKTWCGAKDTLEDGSNDWAQNQDGTSEVIASASAINADSSWWNELHVKGGEWIQFLANGGTDSSNGLGFKIGLWIR